MKKSILLLFVIWCISMAGFAQTSVRGIVTDNEKEPMPGVTVVVDNTTVGTVTAMDGSYNLSVPDNAGVLIFSFVGMKTKEVKISGQSVLNVQLEPSLTELDEVVAIGYGTMKKSDLTGSVSSIKTDDLVQDKKISFIESMQGKMAGVHINQQSGEPGAAIDIKIRGANSVYGSSNPLFVIDGVQMDINSNEVASATVGSSASMNPLAFLNPDDIESIEVLKDASATAIYGSRGANGVVLITTKSGKAGKSTIVYDSFVSVSQASKKLDMLNGSEYIDYRKKLDVGNTDPMFWKDTNSDGIFDTEKDLSGIIFHNWQDEMLRTAMSHSHNISVSGGNASTRFSTGLGYLNQQGIVKNNGYSRINARVKVDHDFNAKLKTGVNLNMSYSEQNGASGAGGGLVYNGVVQSLVLSKPVEDYDPNDPEDAQYGMYISPLSMINEAQKGISLTQMVGSTYLEYEFLKDFTGRAEFGGNMSSSKGQEFYGKNTTWGNVDNGRAVLQDRKTISWFVRGQLNYQFEVGKNHSFNLMGAYEINHYNFEAFSVDMADFPDESTGVNDISKGGVMKNVSSNRWGTNRISYLSRINYNLMGKYLFTASLRSDGSDKFGPGNRFGLFPSAALAWRVSQEDFLKNQKTISNLKLRLSYGVTGNERIPAYSYFASMENAWYSSNGSLQLGLAPSSKENPNLKWETTDQYNVGFDLGLIKDRISLSVDLYDKKTSDMLLLTPVASQSGYFEQWSNIGDIDNKGFEVQVNTRNVQKKKFTWNTTINVSHNQNKVTSLGDATSIPVTIFGGWFQNVGRIQVGEPIGRAYGYAWDGMYQIDDFTWQENSNPDIPYAQRTFSLKDGVVKYSGGAVKPGSFKFKDLNNDGVIDDQNDRTYISNSNPLHFGGVNNSFTYGQFDLSCFLEWQYGNQILNVSKYRMEGSYSKYFNITKSVWQNYWTPDNPTNLYGAFDNTTSAVTSSYYVEDGSYLRLSNITLGYNFSGSSLSRVGIKNLRIYFTGSNLKTWTNYSGYDPDISFNNPLLTGFDRLSYPRSKSYILGLNLTF